MLAGWDRTIASIDHYEFYWFPHRLLPDQDQHAAPSDDAGERTVVGAPLHRRRAALNKLFGLMCAIGRRVPARPDDQPTQRARAVGATIVDSSTNIFISSREVRFREMGTPSHRGRPRCAARVRAMIDKRRYRVSFPIEVRAAAADDLMLSTAAGRESGYIAVHRYAKDDPADSAAYFADVEAIMTAHAGRPHWGRCTPAMQTTCAPCTPASTSSSRSATSSTRSGLHQRLPGPGPGA